MGIIVALLLTLLVAGAPAPAEATGRAFTTTRGLPIATRGLSTAIPGPTTAIRRLFTLARLASTTARTASTGATTSFSMRR